jgi:hypothetical protein
LKTSTLTTAFSIQVNIQCQIFQIPSVVLETNGQVDETSTAMAQQYVFVSAEKVVNKRMAEM